MPWKAIRRAFLLLASAYVGGHAVAVECPQSASQFRAEVLGVLARVFPDRHFTKGKNDDVVLLGQVEFGLQNLRARLCSPSLAVTKQQRDQSVEQHFRALLAALQKSQPSRTTWEQAKDKVLPQLMPDEYAGMGAVLVRRVVPGVSVGIVVESADGYSYARDEDVSRWGVTKEKVFEKALGNLDLRSQSARLQGNDGAEKFLAFEDNDGFDAVKILLPWVREEASKRLGTPYLAALPNRDFVVMWSEKNSAAFQEFARNKARKDFLAQPYPLTPSIVRVWKDGRIEEAR